MSLSLGTGPILDMATFLTTRLDYVVALILRLARDNPRWGYLRIVGECAKFGVTLSAMSVCNLLRRHRLTGVWRDFRVSPGRSGRGEHVFPLRVN
jgi:hypothetical protein